MKKIRTLVIDDEPLARARIIKLLEQFPDILMIGECKNGTEALQKITDYKPDLIFLDIQMPDFNGFELISKSQISPMPFVIFVTAYDQYAVKAFGVHAVDYLLKPYDDDRFNDAVHQAKQQIELNRNAELHKKMVQLIENHNKDESQLNIIEIKEKGYSKKIQIEEIYFLESHGNYLKLYLENKSYLIRQTLQALVEQLDKNQFFRIHRSYVINLNYVEDIKYKGNNQFLFYLKNKKELLSSRSFKTEIELLLDNGQ